MRSFLRDFLHHARSARTDLLIAWLAFLAFAIGGCATARGEGQYEAKARAALALAKAKRERELCFTDYAAALSTAERTHKHLVVWVGVKCTDEPRLRRDLADAVHCHLSSHHGDRTPRVVIRGADGVEWFVRPEKIVPDTARKIRAKWDELRRDVGISEE